MCNYALGTVSPGNAPFGEIIRRKLNPHPITWHDTHEIHLHLPREVGEHQVFTIRSIYLDTEYRIRQGFRHRALDLNRIALCHTILSHYNRKPRALRVQASAL